ncbi:MAG: F0F1 ATP synthase subunit delta [Ancalomicrobiaceae bacterium]|nr:F0F1 ATP synthase subunit delta [Ancalomicrobiaceae bacterium]
MRVAETTSIVSGVAERYAGALFEAAAEAGVIDAVGSDLDAFQALIDESADLHRLVRSPIFSAEEQKRAVAAVLARAGISGYAANVILVAAANRRLFVVPDIRRAYKALVAAHRGEVTADIVSAEPLTETQADALKAALLGVAGGKGITLATKVDPSLIGGLVVKIGSRMVDTSLKTKLSSLKVALKEVR